MRKRADINRYKKKAIMEEEDFHDDYTSFLEQDELTKEEVFKLIKELDGS